MGRYELGELRGRVSCVAVLEQAGFEVDARESTRRAVKYRRGDDIIIVIHDGEGWFDPLSPAKGDVFKLVEYIHHASFPEALACVAGLIGFEPTTLSWTRRAKDREPATSVLERWQKRRLLWRGSATWHFLRDARKLPDSVLRAATQQGRLREGPYGSMWAAHVDDHGDVTGWEEHGLEWRGFSTGGAKILFRFGPIHASRLCVTEAAIDAMSLAALERGRTDSLYLSTGGGWSLATDVAIRALAARPGVLLIAATDNDSQGERYADRLQAAASEADCGYERLRSNEVDWNAELKARSGEERKEKGEAGCRMPAGRVKGKASPGCAGP
jgi:hypothetical protein